MERGGPLETGSVSKTLTGHKGQGLGKERAARQNNPSKKKKSGMEGEAKSRIKGWSRSRSWYHDLRHSCSTEPSQERAQRSKSPSCKSSPVEREQRLETSAQSSLLAQARDTRNQERSAHNHKSVERRGKSKDRCYLFKDCKARWQEMDKDMEGDKDKKGTNSPRFL